jgi:aspartokinase
MISKIKKLYEIADIDNGDFLTVTHGMYEIMIISNRKHKTKILDLLEDEKVIKVWDKLSSLTVRIPISASETVGVFYVITKAINWENINIVDIVSTLTEMTFVLDEDDVSKAFSAVKKLINES